jgi:hypothetical protein
LKGDRRVTHHLPQSFSRFTQLRTVLRPVGADIDPIIVASDEGDSTTLRDRLMDEVPLEVEIIGLTPQEQQRVLAAFPGGSRFRLKGV